MLLVKTYLNKSSIPNAGLGCFAAEFIPSGTKIWTLNSLFDRIYTEADLDSLTVLEKDFINVYAYKCNGLYILCVDNAKFFNHSDLDCNTVDIPGEYATYACIDIPKNTEIFSNYNTFGVTEDDKQFNRLEF